MRKFLITTIFSVLFFAFILPINAQGNEFKGKEVLLLYLNINPKKSAVTLDHAEVKYGVAPQNRSPSFQKIQVILEGQIIYQAPFSLQEIIQTYTNDDPLPQTLVSEKLRGELVIVPYVPDSEIFIRDETADSTDKVYFSLETNSLFSTANINQQLKEDSEQKDKEVTLFNYKSGGVASQPVSQRQLLKEAEAIEISPSPTMSFFSRFINWIVSLYQKIFQPDVRAQGDGSRQLKILFVSLFSDYYQQGTTEREACNPVSRTAFESFVRDSMNYLYNISPFNEFQSKINAVSIYTAQRCQGDNNCIECSNFDDCLAKSRVETRNYDYNQLINVYPCTGRSSARFGGGDDTLLLQLPYRQ